MSSHELTKIRNNSFIIVFSQIISLVLNIVSISFAARYLGVEQFGKFNYLLALVGIGAKIIDFGFNPIIFRELSLRNNIGKYLGSVFVFRSVIILVITILFGFLGFMLGLGTVEITLVMMLSLNILFSNKFTNIRELITIPFKVELKMYLPMSLVIWDNVLLLILVLMMPLFDGGILYFVIVYTVSNIPGMLFLFYFLKTKYDFNFRIDFFELKYLFNESLPLMGFIIFAFLYSQIDILMLENLSDSTSVGIYSSALRLIMPLKLIPNTVVISLFAIIVNNIGNDTNQRIIKFITKLFFLFSISFSALMFIGSEEIISIIFGEKYLDASLPLKVLSIGLFFDFFSFFILDIFTAHKKQKFNFQFILIVTLVVLISNIVLIPSFDFIGASISRVISGFLGFIFLLIILKQKLKINVSFISLKLLLVVLLFVTSIYILGYFNIIINILVSNVVFLMLIIRLKVFSIDEVEIITKLTNNEKINTFIKRFYASDK